MDLDEAREFVRGNAHTVLATLKRDGTPQLTPVNAVVDDEGWLVICSRETAFKVKNVRREPRVWLCVLPDAFYGAFVQVEGTADVLSLPDAMEPLVDYYRRAAGEHPDWDDYRAAMVRDQRCLIRITPAEVGPTVAG